MDTEKQPKETFVEQMERVNRTNPFMIHNNIRAVALSEDAAEAVCGDYGGFLKCHADSPRRTDVCDGGDRSRTCDEE